MRNVVTSTCPLSFGPTTVITQNAAPTAMVRERPKIARTCSGSADVATS